MPLPYSSVHYRWDTTEADTNNVPMLKIVYAYTMQITGGINRYTSDYITQSTTNI